VALAGIRWRPWTRSAGWSRTWSSSPTRWRRSSATASGKLRVTTNHHAVGGGATWGMFRDMLKPGTSALFLVVEKVTPDKAVEGLRQYGGTVLKSSLSKETEAQLQDALHGEGTTA
jgi:hypothetical protein